LSAPEIKERRKNMITTIAIVTGISYVSALTVAYRIRMSRKKYTKK